jgi:hypothetical protein
MTPCVTPQLPGKGDNLKGPAKRRETEADKDLDQLAAAAASPAQAVEAARPALPEVLSLALLLRVMKVWQIWYLSFCMVLKGGCAWPHSCTVV